MKASIAVKAFAFPTTDSARVLVYFAVVVAVPNPRAAISLGNRNTQNSKPPRNDFVFRYQSSTRMPATRFSANNNSPRSLPVYHFHLPKPTKLHFRKYGKYTNFENMENKSYVLLLYSH